jgi:hypothetical protein
MKLYHATSLKAAESILKEGFRDGTGTYLTQQAWSGVGLSDVPLDESVITKCGETLLEVDIELSELELSEYDWPEEGKPYREFLIPASVVNSRGRIRVVENECGPLVPLPSGYAE